MLSRCINAVKAIHLPDRTKVFLSSMWLWAYIMFYFTKCINKLLGLILVYTPDSLIIFNPYLYLSGMNNTNKSIDCNKPIIIDAYLKNNNDKNNNDKTNTGKNNNGKPECIINKIRALINAKWDIDIGNDNCSFDDSAVKELFGGLNVREIVKIYPLLSTSIIWITYLFETDKILHSLSDDELGKKIKFLLINFSDNILYRNSNLENPEKIIVGDIPF
jgi:hypothetical protein